MAFGRPGGLQRSPLGRLLPTTRNRTTSATKVAGASRTPQALGGANRGRRGVQALVAQPLSRSLDSGRPPQMWWLRSPSASRPLESLIEAPRWGGGPRALTSGHRSSAAMLAGREHVSPRILGARACGGRETHLTGQWDKLGQGSTGVLITRPTSKVKLRAASGTCLSWTAIQTDYVR